VEDVLQKTRRVRCSISSFANLGAILEGTSLLATVPVLVADQVRISRAHLRTAKLPFPIMAGAMELLWSAADDDDPAGSFMRAKITMIAKTQRPRGTARRRAAST
jgi:LysR family transcriptional activator of mexEF-oprN operon